MISGIKINKLHLAILSKGRAEEELKSIQNSLRDKEFDSQQYNDYFINIYGYDN